MQAAAEREAVKGSRAVHRLAHRVRSRRMAEVAVVRREVPRHPNCSRRHVVSPRARDDAHREQEQRRHGNARKRAKEWSSVHGASLYALGMPKLAWNARTLAQKKAERCQENPTNRVRKFLNAVRTMRNA